MTHLLYQTDSYLQTFVATVTAVDETNRGVILDRTAFYPGGGGQPADRGTITASETAYSMPRIKRIEGQLVHLLEGDGPLPVAGTEVVGKLDWDLRYKLMRTHTAMHILCGVIFRDYGASVTGGDMEPVKGRMDFEF